MRLSAEEIPRSCDKEESSCVSIHHRLLGAGEDCRQDVVQGGVPGLCLQTRRGGGEPCRGGTAWDERYVTV